MILVPMYLLFILLCALNIGVFFNICFVTIAVIVSFFLMSSMGGTFTGYLSEINADMPSAIEATIPLIGVTKNSLSIFSGSLNPQFYGDQRMIEAFARLPESVTVEVILSDPSANVREHPLKEWIVARNVLVWRTTLTKSQRHFIVSDGVHVRLETPHDSCESKRIAVIWYDTRFLGRKFTRRFARYREKGTRLLF
jgi:hypothetical protein